MTAELSHDRRGSGEPLLLVHGIGDRWQTWEPVLDRLAAEREVVAVDAPGFGASPPLPAGQVPTVESLAAAIGDFADGLGLERPHVAGNSMGGGIALELGRMGRARTVTALSPSGFAEGWEERFARLSLRATVGVARHARAVADAAAGSAAGRTLTLGQMYARPWRIPAPAVRATIAALAAAPGFDATLENLTAWTWAHGDLDLPVTVAWGERDRLLLPRQAERARRRMPRARHVWLYGCGHVPMWDDPEQVARVLLAGARERPAVLGAA